MEHHTYDENPSRHSRPQTGKKDFTQPFPQAKLKEDIYPRFPAGFEHFKTQMKPIRTHSSITKLVYQTQCHL
jgi:hypothetical protein